MNPTIIHISDLHFHTYPQNFQECKSKRILGMGNLFFRRVRQYPLQRAKLLVEQILQMKWDHLVISGDLTQLSLEREFSLARETLAPLLKDPERVTIIPGNHDRYVKQSGDNPGSPRNTALGSLFSCHRSGPVFRRPSFHFARPRPRNLFS